MNGRFLITIFTFFSTFLVFNSYSKTLDKILAVYDNQIITLSHIERFKQKIDIMKEISPHLYEEKTYDQNHIVNHILYILLTRDLLSKNGYSLAEEDVERQIASNEQRLQLGRDQLISFLKSKNITFREYHEIIKEAMEFGLFQSQIMSPAISISEQAIKNTFYKKNGHDKTLAFKYDLFDFSVTADLFKNLSEAEIRSAIFSYIEKCIFPEKFRSISHTQLTGVEEEDLQKDLRSHLKNTLEAELSNAIKIENYYHFFYVKKKDLVDSQNFIKEKIIIENELIDLEMKKLKKNMLEREKTRHYIKIFN